MTTRAWYPRLSTPWRGGLLAGIIHLLLSVPFLTGILIPSIHEGSLYAFGYVVLNLPVISLFGGVGDFLCRLVFGERSTLYQSNLLFMGIAWLWWVGRGCACGAVLDRWRRRARLRQA